MLCIVPMIACILLASPLAAEERTPTLMTLDACLEQALIRSSEIETYRARVARNDAALAALRISQLPRAEGYVSYDRLSENTNSKRSAIGDSRNDYQVGVNVSWPLFTGMAHSAEKNIMSKEGEIARLELQLMGREIAYTVRRAYSALLFAAALVDARRDILASAESFLRVSQALYERRKTPRWEALLRIRIQVNEYRQELLAAEEAQRLAARALWNAMGRESDELIVPDGAAQRDAALSRDALFAALEAHYPELHIARVERDIANERIRRARSGYYPDVTLRGNYRYEFSEEDGRTDWYAGAMMSVPLTGIIETRPAVAAEREGQAAVSARYETLRRGLRGQLDAALGSYQIARTNSDLAAVNVRDADASLRAYQNRYQSGLVSSQEMLEAFKTSAGTRLAYEQQLHELRVAYAAIIRLGGSDEIHQ
jgi:outer membrane protein TolC